MRAHSVEPTLSWPMEIHRGRHSPSRTGGWSSNSVPAAESPLARVAALLVSISQNNIYEGRDPATVPDALSSGFVADLLGVDIGTLTALLVDLRRRGLVECGANSTLRLKDLDGLQELAN
ncbi:MAG: helix-turn-helix domain-containing protein [Hyphomicrobium sp.]|jgi:CRP-like cAMP-binding protein